MKHSKNTLVLTIIISITLFVFGFYSIGPIYESLLPRVNNGFYQVPEFIGLFETTLVSALVVGVTPILIWVTWRLANIISSRQRLLSAFIVIISMTLAVLLRREMIKTYFAKLTTSTDQIHRNLNVSFPLNKVNFEFYMLGGLLIGCLISFLLFRQRNPSSTY